MLYKLFLVYQHQVVCGTSYSSLAFSACQAQLDKKEVEVKQIMGKCVWNGGHTLAGTHAPYLPVQSGLIVASMI